MSPNFPFIPHNSPNILVTFPPNFPLKKNKNIEKTYRLEGKFANRANMNMDHEAQLIKNLENQLKRLISELEDLEETK
jgi:hypothetical protein